MSSRVCFVYPWATLGGVERVLLNRLIAFKSARTPVEVDLMFLHDSGGAASLKDALEKLGIGARVIVAPDFDSDVEYDLVFCIDCPQAFGLCERRKFRYLAECHTSYVDNREYLRRLPASCEIIVTPSRLFSDRLRSDLRKSKPLEIVELRNFVPWDVVAPLDEFHVPGWVRRPILFFGRMDRHKDPVTLLDSFVKIEEAHPGRFMCVLCGPQSPEIDLHREVGRRNLRSKVLVLPPVPFNSAGPLLNIIRKKWGVFVSPSKGESFGLSAAEAISAGLPVVLSDIKEHCWLVRGHEDKFTYELGNHEALAERILDVAVRYDHMVNLMLEIRTNYSSGSFLDDWDLLLRKLNLQ